MPARSQNATSSKSTGDRRIDWLYDDPVQQFEEYLEIWGLETDQVGLVIGPRIDEEHGLVELEVNLRVLDDEEGLYAIDGIYHLVSVDVIDYLDNVYPTLIERFEDSFPDARLLYFEP